MPFSTEERFIAAAERDLGIALPQAFRAHPIISNVGKVEALDDTWELNPVFDTSDRRHIARTASHIVSETASARKWRNFHEGAVAVASDGCGNYLVFLRAKHHSALLRDAVFVWWHEGGEVEELAKDFAAL